MIRNFLLICLLGCGISLATAGNPPFFTTGTAVNEKGELLMTQKRNQTVGCICCRRENFTPFVPV